jgi:hypothetical protein
VLGSDYLVCTACAIVLHLTEDALNGGLVTPWKILWNFVDGIPLRGQLNGVSHQLSLAMIFAFSPHFIVLVRFFPAFMGGTKMWPLGIWVTTLEALFHSSSTLPALDPLFQHFLKSFSFFYLFSRSHLNSKWRRCEKRRKQIADWLTVMLTQTHCSCTKQARCFASSCVNGFIVMLTKDQLRLHEASARSRDFLRRLNHGITEIKHHGFVASLGRVFRSGSKQTLPASAEINILFPEQ